MNDQLNWNEPLPSWDGLIVGPDADFVFALSGGNTYNETGSGGVVVGGNKDIVAINEPSTGGMVCGGSGIVAINEPSTGGVVCGNSAIVAINEPSTGGIVCGSSAVTSFSKIPTGGIICGSSAIITATFKIAGFGGIVMGGLTSTKTYVQIGSGGCVIGASADVSVYYPPPSGTDAPWINPQLALIYDGIETFSDVSFGKQSQFLVVRGFNFGVPSDDNVLQVLVSIKCQATNSDVRDTEIYLVNSTGIISDNLSDGLAWSLNVDSFKMIYLKNDLNPILSPATVNDPSFGVAVRVHNFDSTAIALAKVDGISIRVRYEDPVGQRIRISGTAFVLSTAMSYEGDGDVNVDGATAACSIKRYFSENGLSGALLGGTGVGQTATHNIVASGGIVLGSSAKVTPFIEIGTGGLVGGGTSVVKPYFEFGLGGIVIGSSAAARTIMRPAAKGGASVGGTVQVLFFHYAATGGLSVSGSSYIRSSVWSYAASGSVFVSGSSDIHGSYLGTFMETVDFESTVSELIVTYAEDQNVPQAVALSHSVDQCECLQIPLVVNFTQNLSLNNKLSQFLFRNNLAFPSIHKLSFNLSNNSWQSNLHYRGSAVDGSGSETWDMVFELQCTKLAGGIDIGRAIWKLAVDVTRKSTDVSNTRLIVGVLPSSICDTLSHELIFKVTYDTQANNAIVEPTSTVYQAILFDNIGLFKNKYWVDNPDLVLKVSQAALDSPQTRLDLTSQVLVN